VTGISGSGKSSLAFDTLFAEGQRRFAESLSSYARQFLGRMSKPDVELIEGIPPAIAIEQKVNTRNPRSTVATSTEIFDYLRMIFARIGRTYSPISGEEVKCHTVEDVLSYIYSDDASAAYVLADLDWESRPDKVELMLQLKEEGYSRFFTDKAVRIEDVMKCAESGDYPERLYLLVDRLRLPSTDEDLMTRLHSSIDNAFDKGNGAMCVRKEYADGHVELKKFINRFEADGMEFAHPDEYLFSFNSPLGA
jgi:excinuclease ABC subunit A